MVKQSVLWRNIEKHYTIEPLGKNSKCKNTKYRCNYCSHIYASNITRMTFHLLKDCPAPITVKQQIQNIYCKQDMSSSSQKRLKMQARWGHVSQHYVKLNSKSFPKCKKEKFMCIYCNRRYANNVTRMAQHVMECSKCPNETKNEFYQLNKPRSSTLSLLSASFDTPPTELEENENGENKNDTFLYADDTIDPMSSNSFDAEIEPFEEKYDITEHISEGVDDTIQSDCLNSQTDCLNLQTDDCLNPQNKACFNPQNEDEIKSLMIRACCSTSTQLNIFENVHWQKLFNIIAPNLVLPTRNELSDKYLNQEYASIKKQVEIKIKDARKLSIQLIGNNNKELSSVLIVLSTPEPVVYDIISSNIINDEINKIVQENDKQTFYPVISKNCDNLELTTFPNVHLSRYKCNKFVLNLLLQDLMELDIFKNVLSKYNGIAAFAKFYKNLEKFVKNKTSLQKLETSKNQIQSEDTVLDLLVSLIGSIVNWMHKIKPDSCISSVVECYSNLRDTFEGASSECILECLDKNRSLAISEVHKAASLLDPHYMGSNLSPDEVIDAIEFITKLSKILPDVKTEKIIFDIAAYRTKQGIWGKQFVWDSLSASEVPAVIWWQSMCSSTELCKIAVCVLSCPPVIVSIEKFNKIIKKQEYIKHNLKLLEIKEDQYGEQSYNGSDTSCSDSELE